MPVVKRVPTQTVVDFVGTFIITNGYSPTIREIGAGVGLASTAAVEWHIDKAVADGQLTHRSNRPRTLRPTAQSTAAPPPPELPAAATTLRACPRCAYVLTAIDDKASLCPHCADVFVSSPLLTAGQLRAKLEQRHGPIIHERLTRALANIAKLEA